MNRNIRIAAILDIANADPCLDYLSQRDPRDFSPIGGAEIARIALLQQQQRLSEMECVAISNDDFHVESLISEIRKATDESLDLKKVGCSIDSPDYPTWRSIMLSGDQDLHILAGSHPDDFSWSEVLTTESDVLDSALSQGVAENHCHLSAFGPVFKSNWLALHNSASYLHTLSHAFAEEKRRANRSEGDIYALYNLAMLSVYLRRYLYYVYSDKPRAFTPFPIKSIREVRRKNESFEVWARGAIRSLPVPSHPIPDQLFDYCIDDDVTKPFDGERLFLSRCIDRYSSFARIEQAMFYLYLIIKRYIASHFIQNNGWFGFKNFQRMQSSHNLFTKKNPVYDAARIRAGFETMFSGANVTKFEVRISPKKSKKRLLQTLSFAKPIFEESCKELNPSCKTGVVLHFIKKSGKDDRRPLPGACNPRCLSVIEQVEKQSETIVQLLCPQEGFAPNLPLPIVGIDAANEEVYCRPEAFAPYYRLFRRTVAAKNPTFGFTYHVGEDFLTLANGLRAIYEAVVYLDMRKDDRLGHGSALGTNVTNYFAVKGPVFYQGKQEQLDDLCFLLQMGKPSQEEREYLEPRIEQLLNEIYRVADIGSYISSLKLRANHPSVFASGSSSYSAAKKICELKGKDFYMCPSFESAWDDEQAIHYVWAYHYSGQARQEAEKVSSFRADKQYLSLLRKAQENLSRLIQKTEIVIETNPTSNYQIGPYRDFDDIPVFSFLGLDEETSFNKGLRLTVGADDPGLFSTNLRNEYASILYTLAQKYPTDQCERILKGLVRGSQDSAFIK